MTDALIREIVDVQDSYVAVVDLGLELFDDTRNTLRMSRYRPIASHRAAFQKIARALNPKDNRCYLLTGNYGTGKSHLCLMFANYLQTPAGEQPMPKFFENYAAVDPTAAEDLKTRRLKNRYLVALCQWGGKGDFEDVVLRAVEEALKREGFGEDLETPYLAALRKLDEWKDLSAKGDPRGRFWSEFGSSLAEQKTGMSVDGLKKGLREFDPAALEEFKRIHQALTTAPFAYDKTDLLPILLSVLKSKSFKDRYLGLLVLFDEFGDTMEKGNMNPTSFMQFAQLCAETPTDAARLVFVGTAHRDLTWYAKSYNATDFRVASDRIVPVPLTPDGVEDIIAAIVTPQKASALWQQEVAARSNVFDGLLADCTRLKLFDWLKAPKIRQSIIENIYPMHPMATYALLQLARDVASNNRSVFKFFSGEVSADAEAGSYGHYLATTPITSKGKLNLYTADLLCDYFAPALRSDNRELRDTVREQVKDYESSLRELNRVAAQDMTAQQLLQQDELVPRLLRLMLVYSIIQVPNAQDNLQFGLYCATQAEKEQLGNRLRELANKGIIYYVKETGVYEFKKSTGVDLDRMVEVYKQDPKNLPANIAAELLDLAPLDKKNDLYVEAKDYNMTYGEDKRLERRIVRAVDLGAEVDTPSGKQGYFAALEAEVNQAVAKRGDFEGIALHVVCETLDDIQKAKDFCARNQSKRVVLAVLKQPLPMLDAVLELKALLAIEASDAYKNFLLQDRAALNARLNGDGNKKGARDVLRGLRDKLFSPKEINWLGQYAAPIATEDNKAYDIANSVMELLYNDGRNKFIHDDFNKVHLKLEKSKAPALKEATEKLLDYTSLLTVDTSFAQQRGDIRYLQKCLLLNGVLVQAKADGNKLRCELEKDPKKYAAKLPALAALVEEVEKLQGSDRLKVGQMLAQYRKPPYGQGPVALALMLACLRRLYGDSIRFKKDDISVGDLPVNSFDDVFNLVDGQEPNAFISYRPLRPEEKALVKVVYKLFGQPQSAASREWTVVEAHGALKNWWDALPALAKVESLYPAARYPGTADFLDMMKKIAARDAHAFLFDELTAVFGATPGALITQATVDTLAEELPKQKQTLDSALSVVEGQIIEAVRQLFGVEQNTYTDVLEGIRAWYNDLDANQRDPYAKSYRQDNDSKVLLLQLKTVQSLPDAFMVNIPQGYGMKAVKDWIVNRTSEYVDRLRAGKQRIDEAKLKVEAPVPALEGDFTQQPGGPVMFKDQVKLTFSHKDPAAKIYVADDPADPTDSASPRALVNGAGPLLITDHKTLRYAAQDTAGNWSRIEKLELFNQHKKYEIKLAQQPGLTDQSASFIFPIDADAFAVTCRSLLRLAEQEKGLNRGQLAQRLQAVLDEWQRGA